MAREDEPIEKQLTDKERRFVEEYCIDFNQTQAAIRAGYSSKTAHAIGWENLRKPYIKIAIDDRLNELSLSAAETTKLISDIAKSNLNEFYDIVEIDYVTRIEKPLIDIIYDLEEEVKFEEEFARRAGLQDNELKSHHSQQQSRRLKIIRLQMELEKEPLAKRIVDGPIEKRKVAELNMIKLVEAKESGRIKTVTPGQFGTKVELYAADAALRDMAKIHGLYAPQKLDHTSDGKSFFELLSESSHDPGISTES